MNKEIEELLNDFKNEECYYVGTNGCLYQDLTKEEINLLLSYIEQLENNRDKALKIIDSYDLGKYNYSIPAEGIIELREALTNETNERNVN